MGKIEDGVSGYDQKQDGIKLSEPKQFATISFGELIGKDSELPGQLEGLSDSPVYLFANQESFGQPNRFTAVVNYPFVGERLHALLGAAATKPGMNIAAILNDWGMPDGTDEFDNILQRLHKKLPMDKFEPHRKPMMRALEIQDRVARNTAQNFVPYNGEGESFWLRYGPTDIIDLLDRLMAQSLINKKDWGNLEKFRNCQTVYYGSRGLQKTTVSESFAASLADHIDDYLHLKKDPEYKYTGSKHISEHLVHVGGLLHQFLQRFPVNERVSILRHGIRSEMGKYDKEYSILVLGDEEYIDGSYLSAFPIENNQVRVWMGEDWAFDLSQANQYFNQYQVIETHTTARLHPTIQWSENTSGYTLMDQPIPEDITNTIYPMLVKTAVEKNMPRNLLSADTLIGQLLLSVVNKKSRGYWPERMKQRYAEEDGGEEAVQDIGEAQVVLLPFMKAGQLNRASQSFLQAATSYIKNM